MNVALERRNWEVGEEGSEVGTFGEALSGQDSKNGDAGKKGCTSGGGVVWFSPWLFMVLRRRREAG